MAAKDHPTKAAPRVVNSLRQRFLLAGCILIATAGTIFWASLQLTRVEDEAMREIFRISDVKTLVQRQTVLSVELDAAQTQAEASAVAADLLDVANALEEQASTIFQPQAWAAQILYHRADTTSREALYRGLRQRLDIMATSAKALSLAHSSGDRTVGSGLGQLDPHWRAVDEISTLAAFHKAVLSESKSLVRVLNVAALPLMILVLCTTWFVLIEPLHRRQLQSQRQLEENKAQAIDLAKRAEAANMAKSNFLATMSHEIRTPMNGVLGVAQALKAQVTEPDQRRMVTWLQDSGETLLQILNDILDFSKIEAGKLELEHIDFVPDELVKKVEAMHILGASERQNTFTVRATGPTGRAHLGDPHRIVQILHNLVGNAVKFTNQGSIEVAVEADGQGTLFLTISDTGVGMSSEQLDRVFEEFSQAEGSISRRFGGTGLGMAIVNRLVRLMGGRITLDSTLGSGTSVHVTLPLTMGELALPSLVPDAQKARDWTDLRVLAADDVDTNRMVLDLLLRQLGINATFVSGGREAIEAVEQEPFDLLLLDISMPEVDGLDALNSIRQVEAENGRQSAPAIAITANALAHQIEEYRLAGFDGHVTKPIKLDVLRSGIEATLLQAAKTQVQDQDVA